MCYLSKWHKWKLAVSCRVHRTIWPVCMLLRVRVKCEFAECGAECEKTATGKMRAFCAEIVHGQNVHNFSSYQDIHNSNTSLKRYLNAESNKVWMIILALFSAEQYIFNRQNLEQVYGNKIMMNHCKLMTNIINDNTFWQILGCEPVKLFQTVKNK
jgi:hypothetical protein